jgi:hypothetical protein
LALLLEAEDEQAMRGLIEERAKLLRISSSCKTSGKPCSRDQNTVPGVTELDAKSFVEAIT